MKTRACDSDISRSQIMQEQLHHPSAWVTSRTSIRLHLVISVRKREHISQCLSCTFFGIPYGMLSYDVTLIIPIAPFPTSTKECVTNG